MAPIKRLARVLTGEVLDELDDLLGDDADEDEVTEHKEMGDE